jgi:hypothetical protein
MKHRPCSPAANLLVLPDEPLDPDKRRLAAAYATEYGKEHVWRGSPTIPPTDVIYGLRDGTPMELERP